jgi:integrase
MQRIEFTSDNLASIKPCDTRQNYRDTSSRLCIRVYPSGKKSFFVNTKEKEMVVIGEYPIVSIKDARIEAKDKYEMHTFASLLEKVKKYESKVLNYRAEKITKRWCVLARKCQILQKILQMNISKDDLQSQLTQSLKEIEARRGKSAIIKTYRKLAELLKVAFYGQILAKQINIKALSKHVPKPQKREIYIHEKVDMKAFLGACKSKKEYEIFIVSLLTCSRIGDIIAMKWSDINLNEGRWVYAPQKQQEDKKEIVHIPLSAEVIEIICKRKKEGEYVFDTSYLAVRHAWISMKKRLPLSLQDLTIHDLRRTHLHWIGYKDFLLVQHSLQHKVGGAAGHYVTSSATFNDRKKAVDKLTNELFML